VALMLRMYQLWLDDLYPRAKFSDGLQIIQKLGHTKEMQMLRKQWIEEDKPKPFDQVEIEARPTISSTSVPPEQQESGNESPEQVDKTFSQPDLNGRTNSRQSPRIDSSNQPEDDELDALLAAEPLQDSHQRDRIFGIGQQANIARMEHSIANEFEDDEDALREMDI
jgi:replication fork protection complex subunit Csm3/Swi3